MSNESSMTSRIRPYDKTWPWAASASRGGIWPMFWAMTQFPASPIVVAVLGKREPGPLERWIAR